MPTDPYRVFEIVARKRREMADGSMVDSLGHPEGEANRHIPMWFDFGPLPPKESCPAACVVVAHALQATWSLVQKISGAHNCKTGIVHMLRAG